MNERKLLHLHAGNISVAYWQEGDEVEFAGYTGKVEDVIAELLAQLLASKNRYLEHPYFPGMPWWGASGL